MDNRLMKHVAQLVERYPTLDSIKDDVVAAYETDNGVNILKNINEDVNNIAVIVPVLMTRPILTVAEILGKGVKR